MKRHAALIGLSQDHHHGLVLARRCKSGEATWTEVAETFVTELEAALSSGGAFGLAGARLFEHAQATMTQNQLAGVLAAWPRMADRDQ